MLGLSRSGEVLRDYPNNHLELPTSDIADSRYRGPSERKGTSTKDKYTDAAHLKSNGTTN